MSITVYFITRRLFALLLVVGVEQSEKPQTKGHMSLWGIKNEEVGLWEKDNQGLVKKIEMGQIHWNYFPKEGWENIALNSQVTPCQPLPAVK